VGIPDGVTRTVYSGTLCTGAERWAFSLWWFRTGPIIAFDYSAGEPSDAAYLAWRAAFLAFMRPEDAFTQLDSYLYAGGAAIQHTQTTFSHVGTSSAETLPPQCSLVLTLRTALQNRSGRGRIYVPFRGAALSTTLGTATSTIPNLASDKLAAYMDSMHAITPALHSIVVSPTTSSFQPITAVDNDLVVDTQRRRRNKMVSARHTAAVAP
jgi:hypothetical protein